MCRPLQAVIYLTWVVSMGVHVGLVQEVQTADLLVCSESWYGTEKCDCQVCRNEWDGGSSS